MINRRYQLGDQYIDNGLGPYHNGTTDDSRLNGSLLRPANILAAVANEANSLHPGRLKQKEALIYYHRCSRSRSWCQVRLPRQEHPWIAEIWVDQTPQLLTRQLRDIAVAAVSLMNVFIGQTEVAVPRATIWEKPTRVSLFRSACRNRSLRIGAICLLRGCKPAASSCSPISVSKQPRFVEFVAILDFLGSS